MWFILLAIIFILKICLWKINKKYFILSACQRITTEDGSRLEDKICVVPGTVPIFGNNLDILNLTPGTIFQYYRKCARYSKGKSYILYYLRHPIYCITTAEDAAALFQNTKVLGKSHVYEFIRPFLGDGLLHSVDQKWYTRRKQIGSAFHFNVLQGFSEIFKEESMRFVKNLQKNKNIAVDVNEVITEFTLNIVIETVMGINLNDISGGAQYRKAIHDIVLCFIERICNPIMHFDPIFKLTSKYKENKKNIQIARDFASKVIKIKREEHRNRQKLNMEIETNADEFGRKKRHALVDTLLLEESLGNIDHDGICDEVTTVMFGGYDTTSSCLMFSLLNLALHRDVQNKCREEIQNIGDYWSLSIADLKKLQYLECVIKETLRLYPSGPLAGRSSKSETHINGLVLTPATQIHFQIYDIMRDPNHYAEPNEFKPERFLPENSIDRHPFAFVPFSAGIRGCIGQKFSMLEMKSLLIAVMSNFEILPVTKLEDVVLGNGITLISETKIFVKFKPLSNDK